MVQVAPDRKPDGSTSVNAAAATAIKDGWKEAISYQTPKSLRVAVWQLGLGHMMMQVTIVLYVCYQIWGAHGWAKTIDITGNINAYVADGVSQGVDPNSVYYCNGNSSYEYDYGYGWTYFNTECRQESSASIYQKGNDQIFITTMYTETTSTGWDCLASNSATLQAQCNGPFDVFSSDAAGRQCTCSSSKTIYPVGVEKMLISFQHTYKMEMGESMSDEETRNIGDSKIVEDGWTPEANCILSGTSETCKRPLDTHFYDKDDNRITKTSGTDVQLRVEEVLALIKDLSIGLDDINAGEGEDVRDGYTNKPFYRTTGVGLTMTLEYSNKDLSVDPPKPRMGLDKVQAEATIDARNGWAGLGAQPDIWISYIDGYNFEKVTRYRQGVLVTFQGFGLFYKFDEVALILAFVTGLVMLGLATTVVDLIATNMYHIKFTPGKMMPSLTKTATSQVLYAKRTETASPEGVMAAQCMYGAMAVSSFKHLDADHDGEIDAADFLKAFAQVGIEWDRALEMTKLIMAKGDRSGKMSDGKLSFAEFVSVLSADTMPFENLLFMMDRRSESEVETYDLSGKLEMKEEDYKNFKQGKQGA